MREVRALAGQIFCARAGEPVGNHAYGAREALIDAARVLTLALNSSEVERALGDAALHFGLPTVWPGVAEREIEEEALVLRDGAQA
jgi:hypothetical protein